MRKFNSLSPYPKHVIKRAGSLKFQVYHTEYGVLTYLTLHTYDVLCTPYICTYTCIRTRCVSLNSLLLLFSNVKSDDSQSHSTFQLLLCTMPSSAHFPRPGVASFLHIVQDSPVESSIDYLISCVTLHHISKSEH